MTTVILRLTALFAGVALLLAGSGLLGTLLALRGSAEGFADRTLGLVMSGYFLGFLFGTLLAPPLVRRIGHVRAFAFLASLAAITALVHALVLAPWGWMLLRVVNGMALVGLYTVIESWLNATAEGRQRGRVFAVYMAINLLALAAGQQLLRLAPVESFALFSLVAMLFCLSLLPVTATRLAQPTLGPMPRFRLRRLVATAPTAAGAAFASGLALGAFWGLAPVYAGQIGLDAGGVASFMAAAILGGALLQWPIGRLSDRGDRRLTLALAGAGAALAAIAAALLPATPLLQTALFAAFGGFAFAVYPVTVAHLMDHVEAGDMLPAGSTVLLVYGVGAALGPALAGLLMQGFGSAALPAYLGLAHLLVAALAGARLLVRRRTASEDSHFHPMLRTTPVAMELLPEAGAGEDGGDPATAGDAAR